MQPSEPHLSEGSSSSSCNAAFHSSCLPQHLLNSVERSDSRVTELDLNCESLGESGCRALARALSLNTCVASLSLSACRHADAVFLCGAISHLTTITHLDLSYCDLQPLGAVQLCSTLQLLTAMTQLNLDSVHLQSSGAGYLCSVLPHLTAITALALCDNELGAADGALICAAAAVAGLTQLGSLELSGNGFDVFDVVDCDAWLRLGLPRLDDDIVGGIDLDWAFLSSCILMFGQGDWRRITLQNLVVWRESAVLPPPVLCRSNPTVTPDTIDRWPGWSATNIPAIPCMLASCKHFALASLSDQHLALPRPLKIHFPYKLIDSSCGLCPRERWRLGSGGLLALLARRLCLPPVKRLYSSRLDVKLVSRVACRVYSWQPNSDIEDAFLNALQETRILRSDYRCFRVCKEGDEFSLNDYLDAMTASQRARLLSSDTCFKILTERTIDPVNGSWFRAEEYPRSVVSELADGIMLNLYSNMDDGDLYFMHENYAQHWQGSIESMSAICRSAVTTFIRTHFIFDFCKVIICELMKMFDRDEFELSHESNFYCHNRCSFPHLCSMLSDVAAVDISLLQPCAPLLLELLDPHWNYLSESEWCGMYRDGSNVSANTKTASEIRSELVSCAASCSSTRCPPFPITNGFKQSKFMRKVSQFLNHSSSIDIPQKQTKLGETPLFVYMQRVSSILSDQLALNCVELRVHGLIGQPSQTLVCSPTDTVDNVLRSACNKFGIEPADWRLYRDRSKSQELPLDKTLDSCSVSGYFTLYLG